jgi:hypothetical protein
MLKMLTTTYINNRLDTVFEHTNDSKEAHHLIDCRQGLHITLAPLSAKIFSLHLEQLENVELHHSVLNLKHDA